MILLAAMLLLYVCKSGQHLLERNVTNPVNGEVITTKTRIFTSLVEESSKIGDHELQAIKEIKKYLN